MSKESIQQVPIAKFSPTEEEIKKVRAAEKSESAADEAEAKYREKIKRANFHIVQDGEKGVETEEERYKRIKKQTEEGIEEEYHKKLE